MLRGHQTRPAAVPASWRGPLPDVSVQRHLNIGGGYAQVPLELVFSDIPDLGILTWALIKLSFEDRAEIATYRQFADELGLGHLQDNAVKRRFLAAVPPLIDAGWLKRTRSADNQVRYQAVVPEGAGYDAKDGKFGVLEGFVGTLLLFGKPCACKMPSGTSSSSSLFILWSRLTLMSNPAKRSGVL